MPKYEPERRETVMKQQIHITLQFDFAIGKVNLNEIVYRLEQLKDPMMIEILKTIVKSYSSGKAGGL
jgi:2'-5' RNA ligase